MVKYFHILASNPPSRVVTAKADPTGTIAEKSDMTTAPNAVKARKHRILGNRTSN
jgi:hypothetical protein